MEKKEIQNYKQKYKGGLGVKDETAFETIVNWKK
jgi:hypothetical protein